MKLSHQQALLLLASKQREIEVLEDIVGKLRCKLAQAEQRLELFEFAAAVAFPLKRRGGPSPIPRWHDLTREQHLQAIRERMSKRGGGKDV